MPQKFFVAGILALLGVTILSIILRSLGFWLLPICLSLFFAVAIAITFTEISSLIALILFLLIASSSLFIIFKQNYNLLGRHAFFNSVSEISNSRWNSSYTFNDAKVLFEKEGSTAIYSSFGKLGTSNLGNIFVAPLVDSQWKTGDPILAWVATDLNDKSNNKAEWTKEHKAAVRLVGGYIDGYGELSKYREAITFAEQKYQLHSEKNAPLLQWTSDPTQNIRQERTLFIKIILGALGIWIVSALGLQRTHIKKVK